MDEIATDHLREVNMMATNSSKMIFLNNANLPRKFGLITSKFSQEIKGV